MTGHTLVGRTGRVTTAVRGGVLAGEVRVVVQGLPHYLLAHSVQPLPVDTYVLIINDRGGRRVDVEPWQPPGSMRDPTQIEGY